MERVVAGEHLVDSRWVALIGLHGIQHQQLVHVIRQGREVVTHANAIDVAIEDGRLPEDVFVDFHIEAIVLA